MLWVGVENWDQVLCCQELYQVLGREDPQLDHLMHRLADKVVVVLENAGKEGPVHEGEDKLHHVLEEAYSGSCFERLFAEEFSL